MRPSLSEFTRYVNNNTKRVGLRLLYRDFNIKDKEYRKKCREAWDFIEGLKDANSKDDRRGQNNKISEKGKIRDATQTKSGNSSGHKKKGRRGRSPKKKKEEEFKKEET